MGILRVAGKNFRMDKFPLKTVRAFHMRQVILSETDLDPADEDAVQEYLAEQVCEVQIITSPSIFCDVSCNSFSYFTIENNESSRTVLLSS